MTEILITREHRGGEKNRGLSHWWRMLPFSVASETQVLRCVYKVKAGAVVRDWFYFWRDAVPDFVTADDRQLGASPGSHSVRFCS